MLCEYGCGQDATFKLNCGKMCCENHQNKCPEIRKKNSASLKGKIGIKRRIIKKNCKFCNIPVIPGSLKRHEKSCHLNPDNIKYCPVCGCLIKNKKHTTCSSKCRGIHFKDTYCETSRVYAHTFEARQKASLSLGGDGCVSNNGTEDYRGICFKYHEKRCIICNEDIAVDVHHVDRNRKNCDPNNLVPLCPTHHRYLQIKEVRKEIETKIKEYISGRVG